MHSSRIFSSFQEIMAGERAACLLDQASIAKVAKSIRNLIYFLCRGGGRSSHTRRSAPEPSAPAGKDAILAKAKVPQCPKRLERPKVTAVVDLEIRLSAYWRGLPPQHRNAPHYAGRTHDAAPDSCRPSRLLCWRAPP